MPLPAALQAKLAKRGLLQNPSTVNEPEEEIIAEDYDDQAQTEKVDKPPPEIHIDILDEVAACPNKWNVYHRCSAFCIQQWGAGVTNPSQDMERKRKRMLKKYPLNSSSWEEIYDCGTGRYYYWNVDTDDVTWLAPSHPKAKIGPCAAKLRKMLADVEAAAAANRKVETTSNYGNYDSDSSEDEEVRRKKAEKYRKDRDRDRERNMERGKKAKKDHDLDPMDPASYSDIPRGSWAAGLEVKGDAKTGVDSTASGPLFQMRPYPSPGAILRANAGGQK